VLPFLLVSWPPTLGMLPLYIRFYEEKRASKASITPIEKKILKK
jgi:hypothetical protein